MISQFSFLSFPLSFFFPSFLWFIFLLIKLSQKIFVSKYRLYIHLYSVCYNCGLDQYRYPTCNLKLIRDYINLLVLSSRLPFGHLGDDH